MFPWEGNSLWTLTLKSKLANGDEIEAIMCQTAREQGLKRICLRCFWAFNYNSDFNVKDKEIRKGTPWYLFFFRLPKAKYYKRLSHKQLPTILFSIFINFHQFVKVSLKFVQCLFIVAANISVWIPIISYLVYWAE